MMGCKYVMGNSFGYGCQFVGYMLVLWNVGMGMSRLFLYYSTMSQYNCFIALLEAIYFAIFTVNCYLSLDFTYLEPTL